METTIQSDAQYQTVKQAAAFLGVTTRTVRRYIADGKLPKYSLAGGDRVRVRMDDVKRLLTPVP